MGNDIHLTIAVPSGIYKEGNAASVILPVVRADINILPERAPSVFVLDFGVIQILEASGSVKERYFIRPGVAQVVKNQCQVMTQDIIPFEDIKPYDAKRKVETAADEQERLFYQMILDYQRGIRRRYLRTLKLFSDKSGLPKTHEEVVADIRAEMAELEKRISAEKVSDKKEEA